MPTSSGIALGWAHVGDWLGLARSSRRARAPSRTQDRSKPYVGVPRRVLAHESSKQQYLVCGGDAIFRGPRAQWIQLLQYVITYQKVNDGLDFQSICSLQKERPRNRNGLRIQLREKSKCL
jgi:hypothetical protein